MTTIEDAVMRSGEISRLYEAMVDPELAYAVAFGFAILMHRSDHATRWVNEAITDILTKESSHPR